MLCDNGAIAGEHALLISLLDFEVYIWVFGFCCLLMCKEIIRPSELWKRYSEVSLPICAHYLTLLVQIW